MLEPRFELLFQLKIELFSATELGETPYGRLRRFDGAFHPDVRALLHTDDGHHIQMTYEGIRSGSAEVWDRVERGEDVDASEYYFRIAARFETGSDKYGWLNRILAFGSGVRLQDGPVYDIYQIT